jgi:hypothetical protein
MQLNLFPKMSEIVPNWSPLEILCKKYGNGRFSAHGRNGKLEITDFMWMHSWDDIQCYKHRMTRRYLNIDNDGKFYRYLAEDGNYHKVSKFEAFEALFG